MTTNRLAIASSVVGAEFGPLSQTVDARWLMAYAAGLGEKNEHYDNTLAPAGPVAYPLFPVSSLDASPAWCSCPRSSAFGAVRARVM